MTGVEAIVALLLCILVALVVTCLFTIALYVAVLALYRLRTARKGVSA